MTKAQLILFGIKLREHAQNVKAAVYPLVHMKKMDRCYATGVAPFSV